MTTESRWANIPTTGELKQDYVYAVVPSDLYNGKIIRIGEPYETTGEYGLKKKFVLEWELSGGDLEGPVALPQFITLPPKFIESGFLSDKSSLYKLMAALGFDMEGAIDVRPWTWEGKEARVDVETKVGTDGVERSFIQGVRPPRRASTPAKAPARQPAAAGPRKAAGWDDDDN